MKNSISLIVIEILSYKQKKLYYLYLWNFFCQFRLLIWTSFIGQFDHSEGGEGRGCYKGCGDVTLAIYRVLFIMIIWCKIQVIINPLSHLKLKPKMNFRFFSFKYYSQSMHAIQNWPTHKMFESKETLNYSRLFSYSKVHFKQFQKSNFMSQKAHYTSPQSFFYNVFLFVGFTILELNFDWLFH